MIPPECIDVVSRDSVKLQLQFHPREGNRLATVQAWLLLRAGKRKIDVYLTTSELQNVLATANAMLARMDAANVQTR